MKHLLTKIITSPYYYAITVTLAGLMIAFISWIAMHKFNLYAEFIKGLDLTQLSGISSGGVLIVIFSLSIYDKFSKKQSIKISAFFSNNKIMVQLWLYVLTAFVVWGCLSVFKKYIDINLIVGLGLSYALFLIIFLIQLIKMIFTDR